MNGFEVNTEEKTYTGGNRLGIWNDSISEEF